MKSCRHASRAIGRWFRRADPKCFVNDLRKGKLAVYVDDPDRRPIHGGSSHPEAHDENFTRLYCHDRRSRYGCCAPDRRVRRMLQLLRAATAALRHLLSAAGRAAAVPDRRGNGDGIARRRRYASHAGSIPDRDGAADCDGRAGRRPVRAHSRSIRHPRARRDGRTRAHLLRAGSAALQFLRLLIQDRRPTHDLAVASTNAPIAATAPMSGHFAFVPVMEVTSRLPEANRYGWFHHLSASWG